MQHLDDILQYSVKIECGDKVGSGTLYVPEDYGKAYILTAAHNFPFLNADAEYVIKIYYEAYDKDKEYVPQEIEEQNTKGNCRIAFLEGYNPDEEDCPNDGAVLEVPREDWMKNSRYQFGRAKAKENLEGVGYPITAEGKYAEFQCWVLESATDNKSEENKDYRVRYNVDSYKDILATDTRFLDGYSGTGLFLEDTDESNLQISAIFSRDAGETSILYATDIVRIYELIENMMEGYFLVYPRATYIDYENLLEEDAVREEDDLNIILEKIYSNKSDYFRCLFGYTGVGKTYTVNLVRRYTPQFVFENSWTKLMECLSAKELRQLKDTVYIIDPLEQLLSIEEREQLLEKPSSQDRSAHLSTDEKLELFKKIEDCSQDLMEYNIHILFIGHNYFWKDVEKRLDDEGKRRLYRKLKNSIVVCWGLDSEKVREILKKESIICPKYFYDIPLIMRPQWLRYVMDNREKLPGRNENQYKYEYNLYKETLKWFEKMGNASGVLKVYKLEELEALDQSRKDYLKENAKYRGNKGWEWKPADIFFLNTYPFEESDGGSQLSDEILYSYLVAETLYEYSKSGERNEFLAYLMDVQEMARNNTSLLKRIPAFFALFLEEDRSGDIADNVKKWLKKDYKDGYRWLYDEKMVLLKSQGKDSEKEYVYNLKDENFLLSEQSKEQAQKFVGKEELVEKDTKMDTKRFIRTDKKHL